MMGWDSDAVNMSQIVDKRMSSLVGESLHLACAGMVFYLVFLMPGPWWSQSPEEDEGGQAPSSPSMSGATASTPEGPAVAPAKKRVRRSACFKLPASAFEQEF